MPDLNAVMNPSERPEETARVTRGVRRALAALGYATLAEFPLANGRRADVFAVDGTGGVLIVEVKSSVEDFRADRKWQEYRDWCDSFWFAVGPGFPADRIPEDCGLMIADGFGAVVARQAPVHRLNAARRKALLLAMARCASHKLHRIEDPAALLDGPGG